ncbi:MAG: magnesium transporter [Ferruginibacter sp.]|nr:magnesium transporter [Ferruginibacter sp.]
MLPENDITLQQQFEEIIATEDQLAIRDFLNNQNISDVATMVYDNPEYETQIISHLSIHRAASVFKILDTVEQKRIIRNLPAFKTTELLNELPADDRVAFLEELPKRMVRELIKALDPEERKITLELMGYPENSVGRKMNPDYVYVYPNYTAGEVLDTIRRYAHNTETIDVIYIIDEEGKLIDDIRIKSIIMSPPETKVEDLIDGRFISLNVNDDKEVANEIFKMNNRVALPVTDNQGILLGIVTIDDVLWIASEEFTEDLQKMGGTEALNEPYLDIGILKLVKKRGGWLAILFLGEMLTASAMQYFEGEIEAATVLALFIPLIMSSGGNSGSQASTLIVQAMAMGEIAVSDWWRVMRRELISGLLLGVLLGSIGFLRLFLWQTLHIFDYGQYYMLVGSTIFCTLIGIVLWGSLVGSMLPFLLKKLRYDPAVSSAPFVATLVDVTGIIMYFSIAYLFLQGRLL